MIPQMKTEIHEILYGTSYPMRQLWGMGEIQTSDSSFDWSSYLNNLDKEEKGTNDRTADINQIASSVEKGAADLTTTLLRLREMKNASENARQNYQFALQSSQNALEIQRLNLLLKQEDVNIEEIKRVTDLAEIARKEKTTKYLVIGGVAVAGVITLAMFMSKRK